MDLDLTPGQKSRTRLLVVDDQGTNRELLLRRFQMEGYQVDSAKSGQECLDKIEAGNVDLVLLDVMMPGMDGFETLRRIREERDIAELPVIIVTAKSETREIVTGLDGAANDYVTKPVDFPVLQARVRTHLTQMLRDSQPRPIVRSVVQETERGEVHGHQEESDKRCRVRTNTPEICICANGNAKKYPSHDCAAFPHRSCVWRIETETAPRCLWRGAGRFLD